MTTRKKIFPLFLIFGVTVVIFSYLRIWFNLLPGDPWDTLIWFLYGPIFYISVRFNMPDFLIFILGIIYYAAIGLILEKIISYQKKKASVILVLILSISGLIVLHWITAMIAAKMLGWVIYGGLLKTIFGPK